MITKIIQVNAVNIFIKAAIYFFKYKMDGFYLIININ